jgi:hypothetical protein
MPLREFGEADVRYGSRFRFLSIQATVRRRTPQRSPTGNSALGQMGDFARRFEMKEAADRGALKEKPQQGAGGL